MDRVYSTPGFVAVLKKIGENPTTEVQTFQVIPSQQRSYSLHPLRTTAAVVLAIASLFTYRHHSKSIFMTALTLTAVVSYSAIESEDIPNSAYQAQQKRINALFDPCIQGLNDARFEKEQAIKGAVHDQEYTSLENVKVAVEAAARTHDTVFGLGRRLDSNDYVSITQSAQMLSNYRVELLPADHPAKLKLEELKSAALAFQFGIMKSQNAENFYYVQYGLIGGKAVIVTA